MALSCPALRPARAACQTTAERQAQLDAQDNDTCLSYGAKHGSDAYVRCRTDLQHNRAIETAATQPVFADPLAGPWGAGPMFCHRSVFGARCF